VFFCDTIIKNGTFTERILRNAGRYTPYRRRAHKKEKEKRTVKTIHFSLWQGQKVSKQKTVINCYLRRAREK
jgi:hypothetical protein